MYNSIYKGVIKILILTLILASFNWLILILEFNQYFGEKFYPILCCFFIQSTAIHLIFKYGKSGLNISASTLIILSIVIRMLTSLIIAGTFIFIGINNLTNFLITFFVIYLFYFVFEIKSVLSNLRFN